MCTSIHTVRASFHAGTEVQGLASLAVVPDKHAVHRRLAATLNTPCWVLVDASIIQVGSGAFVWKSGIYHVYIYIHILYHISSYIQTAILVGKRMIDHQGSNSVVPTFAWMGLNPKATWEMCCLSSWRLQVARMILTGKWCAFSVVGMPASRLVCEHVSIQS